MTFMLNLQSGRLEIKLKLKGHNLNHLQLQGLISTNIKPTNLLPNFNLNWFTISDQGADQPNLIADSGVHPSLHSNCHH